MAGILEQIADMAKQFEQKTGVPPLSKFVETVEKLPDEKRLRLIKEVLLAADKVSQSAPELDKIVTLIREINSLPADKLEQLERILKRIEGILKKAPEELLGFLRSLKE